MKKLIMILIMMLVIPLAVYAGDCERYWDELVEQSFEITIDDVNYTLYFGDSVCGPCPEGNAILSYKDIQIINDIEYTANVEADCNYTTTSEMVIVEGLDFVLFDGKLLLLPEDPLIFNVVVMEEEY